VFQIGFPTSTNFPRFFLNLYIFFSRRKLFSGFIFNLRNLTSGAHRSAVVSPRAALSLVGLGGVAPRPLPVQNTPASDRSGPKPRFPMPRVSVSSPPSRSPAPAACSPFPVSLQTSPPEPLSVVRSRAAVGLLPL
jgi:hypothetical protein